MLHSVFCKHRLTKEHPDVSKYDEQFLIKANVPLSSGLCKLLVGTFLCRSAAQEVKEYAFKTSFPSFPSVEATMLE